MEIMFYELKLNGLNYWNYEKRSFTNQIGTFFVWKNDVAGSTHFQELTFLAFQNNETEVLPPLAGLMILNETRKKASCQSVEELEPYLKLILK